LGQRPGVEPGHGRAAQGLDRTSSFVLSIVDSAAGWVYLHHGAMLAIIAVLAMLSMMLGSTIGVGLLTPANVLLQIVVLFLAASGHLALGH
jgi:uncharacterized membrane protein YfcA